MNIIQICMMKTWGKLGVLLVFWWAVPMLSTVSAATSYDGVIVREIQVTCVSSEGVRDLVREQIVIQAGEQFSQNRVRESLRKIYALKRFSQITVEAEAVAGGVRLSFCPVQIKTISKIRISGNKAVSQDKILNVLEIQAGDRVLQDGIQEARQRVLTLYREQGFHQVQVSLDTTEEPGVEKEILLVNIQEGTPSKIGSITLQGLSAASEQDVMKASKLRPGMHFTLETLEDAGKRIVSYYAEQGFLHAEVVSQDMTYNYQTGEADLVFTLREGNRTSILLEGNVKVKTKILRKLLNIFQRNGAMEDILAENVSVLRRYYLSEGYHFVRIDSEYSEEADAPPVITFTITEGPQVYVKEIKIEGNRAFTTKQLREQMLTSSGGIFSKGLYQDAVFDEDLLAIKALYQQNGFLEAELPKVEKEFSLDQRQVSLRLSVDEGIQTSVERIEIQGETDDGIMKQLRKRLAFRENAPLDVNKISQSIEKIRDFYANQGYIQVEIDVSTRFTEDKSRASVMLTISRGKQYVLGKITIQGVVRTRPVFITRELQVKEGDVYNPQKIRETVRRLLQLGFYETVTFRRLDPKSEEPVQDMLLAVKETSAKTVEFGVGYSTETDFKGFVEYADKNVLNYGGQGTARVEMSIDRPKLTLEYRQPHFFTQDASAVLSVFDDIQKDNESFEVEKRGGRLAIHYNISKALSMSAGYFFEQDDPSNVKGDAVLSSLDTAILTLAGLDARVLWDNRDSIIAPKKGNLTRIALRTALDPLGAETEFVELTAQSNWYAHLFSNVVVACSLAGKLIEPIRGAESVPIYTRYFLGGDTSVRGFAKHGIGPLGVDGNNRGGDRMMALNAEIRFPLYGALGGVVFYDTGANWLNEEGFDSEDLRESLGAGLRIATPIGPLRFDYGRKLDRRSGESAGEYYLTIGSAF